MKSALFEEVCALLIEVADSAILARRNILDPAAIEEKSPGEIVTLADRDAEALISSGLRRLTPQARIVGEEACAAEPGLLDRLDEGLVWLIDPLDGTANFVEGRPEFATMVALLKDGEIIGSAIYEPMSGQMSRAEAGAGAWQNGERLTAPFRAPRQPLKGVLGRFMPAAVEESARRNAGSHAELLPTLRSAGAEYPLLARGERHFAFYWRTISWDHAPGVLLLNEAGGRAARPDGSRYVPGSPANGLFAVSDSGVWADLRALVL